MNAQHRPAAATSRTERAPWWRSAVIYEVYIRSFADGNGDGVGDLAGLRSRLPYLRDLGVDAIWVTPWYPSPMADGGYDISDYRDIAPELGTLAEAGALIQEAHELGLRVIIDLVPNHTSHRHPWFRAALAAAPWSPERGRYVFRPGRGARGELPPNNWRSAFGGPAWTRVTAVDGAPGEWYLHLFAPEQPDLNWDNPEVRAEFEAILAFWLDRGVDGFRIDTAARMVKHPDLPDAEMVGDDLFSAPTEVDHPYKDREGVHDIYRAWRRVMDTYPGERIFVAEAWLGSPRRLARYLRPGELSTAFNFDFLKCPWDAARLREVIDATLASHQEVGAPATWVLSNHDVVRHVTRYAQRDGGMPAARGQADGPMDPDLGVRRARAAALLMFALPGGAYVYQGEELGLGEVLDLPEDALRDPVWQRSGHTERGRDGCRVPMPWSGDIPPFGFGPEGSARAWLPQPETWKDSTVEAEEGAPGSMLELYRDALRTRREHPAFGDGTLLVPTPLSGGPPPTALSYRPPDGGPTPACPSDPLPGSPTPALRWLEGPDDALVFAREAGFVCAVNLGPEPLPLLPGHKVLLASGPLDGRWLPPDTAVWLTS